MSQRGEIIDYEVTAEVAGGDPSIVAGDTVPLLVVAVNEDDETVSGVAFLTNGTTRYVNIPKEKPAEPAAPAPAPTQDEITSELDSMDPATRDAILAKYGVNTDPAPVQNTNTSLDLSKPNTQGE